MGTYDWCISVGINYSYFINFINTAICCQVTSLVTDSGEHLAIRFQKNQRWKAKDFQSLKGAKNLIISFLELIKYQGGKFREYDQFYDSYRLCKKNFVGIETRFYQSEKIIFELDIFWKVEH